jgi:LAS superfamily LD-carboxypeptidase LdcB
MLKNSSVFFVVIFSFFGLNSSAQDTSYAAFDNFLLGKVKSWECPYFTSFEVNGRSFYLHKNAYDAFIKMQAAARKDSITLIVKSAGRSFYHQKQIWEKKFSRCIAEETDTLECVKHLLKYSAMPGTSRHHWGTEIDLNNLNFEYFESGYGKKVKLWLDRNAHNFGFCQVYDNQSYSHRLGYNYEPWHYSYTPVSHQLLIDFNKRIDYNLISGFSGDKYAQELDIINKFVNGIGFICHP